jgi:hypothetical protein
VGRGGSIIRGRRRGAMLPAMAAFGIRIAIDPH